MFKTWPVIIQTVKVPMKVYLKPLSSSKGRKAVTSVIRKEIEESHREIFDNTFSSPHYLDEQNGELKGTRAQACGGS